MERQRRLTLEPIGWVRSPHREMADPKLLRQQEVEIELLPGLAAGLDTLAPGDPILVVFYFHLAAPRGFRLRLHPRDDQTKPLRGVFATRTPYRPNSLGVTVARVLAVEGNRLWVDGLDALDGTPVLDIKNHSPAFDAGEPPAPEGEM